MPLYWRAGGHLLERPVSRSLVLPLLVALWGCSDGKTPAAQGAVAGDAGAGPDAAAAVCEPCVPGTGRCHDRHTRAVCNPRGTCHVVEPCPDNGAGQLVCDQATATCVAAVCDPGAFFECVDGKTSRRCNESGTAVIDVECHGCVDGDASVACLCRPADEEAGAEGGCQPLVCRPGDWACFGDEERHQCSEDGTRWILREDCNGNRAAICEESTDGGGPTARCVPLCDADRKNRSYLGCEYWAVDLDNYHGSGWERDAQSMQFAVVVSNASDVTAHVKIDVVDGAAWCKPWEDLGPDIPYYPYARWCYLTEERCWDGERRWVEPQERGGQVFAVDMKLDADQGGGTCGTRIEVPPGELRVLNLPRRDVSGTVQAPLAYRITTDAPISAYQFNPLENVLVYSNDASLLLPIHALGKHYRVMSRAQSWQPVRAYLTVVAVRPGETSVLVDTAANTIQGGELPRMDVGDRQRFTLQQFDVLNLATRCDPGPEGVCRDAPDPTGSQVVSDKLVAVFGGSQCANAPTTNHCVEGACYDGSECEDHSDCGDLVTCCCDHIEEQLYPVSAWGRRYVAARSSPRGEPLGTGQEPDVWRVLANSDGTEVVTVPHQAVIPVLDKGQWYEFESTEDFELQASRAVLLGQYLASEHAPDPRDHNGPGDARTGDPAFILAVPVEQYREDYVVLTPDRYEHDFVTVIAPPGAEVQVDEGTLAADQLVSIADGAFGAARLPVDDGVHRIRSVPPRRGTCTSTDACQRHGPEWTCVRPRGAPPGAEGDCLGPAPKVGVTVYGYDQYVSYGYPGGLNLDRVNVCRSDADCPVDAACCRAGMPCAAEFEGECVGR